MRKTYAYNGILIGIILGFGAGAYTNNGAIGFFVAVIASVLCFLGIRGLENALSKGIDKAGEAISRKLDEAHANKMRREEQQSSGEE